MKPLSLHRPQQGIVLFVALMVLVIMAIGGVALVRSVDTTGLVSGNLAFRMASTRMTDVGLEAAITTLPTYTTNPDANFPTGCTSNCQYYAQLQTTTTTGVSGVPVVVNWTNVAQIFNAGGNPFVDGYEVRYVIDRLCRVPAPPAILDIPNNCFSKVDTQGESNASQSTFLPPTPKVFYRITARVDGPRSTAVYTQAIVQN